MEEANALLSGKVVIHAKTGNQYIIDDVEVANREGKAYFDVRYYGYETMPNGDNYVYLSVPFNRPCSEFFDGRYKF